MIKLVLLLCTAVFGVLGVPGHTEAPTPCCTPSQWEGVVQEVNGHAFQEDVGLVTGSIDVSYDYLGKRIATFSHLNLSVGAQINEKVINDFKGGIQYVIRNNTCTKYALSGPMSPICVPDDAKFGGSFYFGVPSNQLPCQRWLYTSGVKVKFAVTQQDCIPVIDTEYDAHDSGILVGSFAFTSMTIGIKDTTVFIPPPFCNKVSRKHPHHQLKGLHRYVMNGLRR